MEDLHAIFIDPPISFGFDVVKLGFNGGSELYANIVSYDKTTRVIFLSSL
jgi:hypothetical protein